MSNEVLRDATVAMDVDAIEKVRADGYVVLPSKALRGMDVELEDLLGDEAGEDQEGRYGHGERLVSIRQADMVAVKIRRGLVVFHGSHIADVAEDEGLVAKARAAAR